MESCGMKFSAGSRAETKWWCLWVHSPTADVPRTLFHLGKSMCRANWAANTTQGTHCS